MSTFIRKDEPGMVAHVDLEGPTAGTKHEHTWDEPGDHVEVTSDELARQLLRQDGFTEVNEDGSDIEGAVASTDVVSMASLIDPGLETRRTGGQTPGRSEIRVRIDGSEETDEQQPGQASRIDVPPEYSDAELLEYFDQVETHGEPAVEGYLAVEKLLAAGVTEDQLLEYFVLEQEVGAENVQAYLDAETAAKDA